jgi:hypothetical protein
MKKCDKEFYFSVDILDDGQAIITQVISEKYKKEAVPYYMKRDEINIRDFDHLWKDSEELKDHYIDEIMPALAESQEEALEDIYKDCETHEELIEELASHWESCISQDVPRISESYWKERDRLQRIANGEEQEEYDPESFLHLLDDYDNDRLRVDFEYGNVYQFSKEHNDFLFVCKTFDYYALKNLAEDLLLI